jgi:hypothetical protein
MNYETVHHYSKNCEELINLERVELMDMDEWISNHLDEIVQKNRDFMNGHESEKCISYKIFQIKIRTVIEEKPDVIFK